MSKPVKSIGILAVVFDTAYKLLDLGKQRRELRIKRFEHLENVECLYPEVGEK